MKHKLEITLMLVLFFLLAHFIGLAVINTYQTKTLPYNIQPPAIEEETSFVFIFIIILISTAIALILIKFKIFKLWKLWFFIAILFTLSISFSAFIPQVYAFVIALILALIRFLKANVLVHNLTEIFIYGGLAAILIPILNLVSISILLILISAYDFISVFKTKHMIKMAKFQTKQRIFTGLSIPYAIKNKKRKKAEVTTAILGGGDIGFTLLFSGVILKSTNLLNALVVSFIISLSLLALLIYSRKNKFYPAMPYLTAGCFLGYLLVTLY